MVTRYAPTTPYNSQDAWFCARLLGWINLYLFVPTVTFWQPLGFSSSPFWIRQAPESSRTFRKCASQLSRNVTVIGAITSTGSPFSSVAS